MAKPQKEHPELTGFRLYKNHRQLIKLLAKKLSVSQAEAVRRAIENYAAVSHVA